MADQTQYPQIVEPQPITHEEWLKTHPDQTGPPQETAVRLGISTPAAGQPDQVASALGVNPSFGQPTAKPAPVATSVQKPPAADPNVPSMPQLDQSTPELNGYIAEASKEFGVPEEEIRKTLMRESGARYDAPATNSGRDVGIGQESPGAVTFVNNQFGKNFTPADRFDKRNAIRISAGYLRGMYNQFGQTGGWQAAQDAYQTGPDGYRNGVRPGGGGGTGGSGFSDLRMPPQFQSLINDIHKLSEAKQREMAPLIEQLQEQMKATQPLVIKAFNKLLDSEVNPGNYPQPQIPQSNPLAAFGSVLGIFTMIAAGFTRAPAIAATNAMARLISGAREADLQTYKLQYQKWKDNTELMFRRHDEMAADYKAAIDLLQTDMTGAKAALAYVSAKYDDHIASQFNELNLYEKIYQQQNARDAQIQLMRQRSADIEFKHAEVLKTTAEAGLAQQKAEAANELVKAQRDVQAAEDAETPDPKAVTAAQKKVARAQQAYDALLGKTATSASQREAAIAAKMAEHPEWGPNAYDRARIEVLADEARAKQAGSAMSNDAIDLQARISLKTLRFPYYRNQADRDAVVNRAAELAKEQGHTIEDYLVGSAQWRADQSVLTKMQLMRESAASYERAAAGEFNLAVAHIPQTPEPMNMQLLTRWARTGEKQFGDVQVPQYMTAMISALDEYAKVLSGGTGSVAASTDTARNQALSLIPEGATTAQIPAIVEIIKQGMDLKIRSYDDQLAEIRGRIGGQAPGATKEAPPTPAPGSAYKQAPAADDWISIPTTTPTTIRP